MGIFDVYIIFLIVWISLWNKLRVYKMPPYPVRWSCRGFRSLCRALMLIWMIGSKNDLKVSHRNQVNVPSNINLENI